MRPEESNSSQQEADRLRMIAEQANSHGKDDVFQNARLEEDIQQRIENREAQTGNPRQNPHQQNITSGNHIDRNHNPRVQDSLDRNRQNLQRNQAQNTRNNIASKAGNALGNAGMAKVAAADPKIAAALAAAKGFQGIGNAAKGAVNKVLDPTDKLDPNKNEGEKTAREKDADDKAKDMQSGSFRVAFSRVTMIKLALAFSVVGCVLLIFVVIISTIADNISAGIVMGNMSSEDKSLVEDVIKELGTEVFNSSETGRGDDDFYGDPLYEYYKRFEVLGNVFSSQFKCEEAECTVKREEFRYFLKVADISLRYKNKYQVNLDWILLNATAMYSDVTVESTMGKHIHDYNEKDVEKYNILMDLDWDYDYKKIPGYRYLDANDSRYDLQILAKNMVTKTTVQTCTKEIKDSKGNVIGVEIVKEQTDIDIEEQYFEPGEPYRLECPPGTRYDRTSTYVLDPDKYYEFLLEYIEKKYFLAGDARDFDYGEFEPSPEVGNGTYIFPLPKPRCMSSPYGFRAWDKMFHGGVDWPAPEGTPIYAIADGTVVASGSNPKRWPEGIFVKISHGNGIESLYLHGSSINVKNGDTIKQGQVIMTVGNTGYSSGSHLHFEYRVNGRGVEPSPYVGSVKPCG